MWDKGINGRAPEGGDFTKRSQACYTLSNSEWEKGGILFLQPRYQTGKAIDRECAGGEMLSRARSNHRLPCILLPGCGGRQTTTRRRREKIKKRIPELVPAPGCAVVRSYLPTISAVSMAIMSSSSVGMSSTYTLESAEEMTVSLPRTLLASASIFTPMNSRPEATAMRVAASFSPTPAVNTMASTPPMAAA